MGATRILREKVFELNKALAKAVIDWQQMHYQDVKENVEPDYLPVFEQRLDRTGYFDSEIKFFGEIQMAVKQGTTEAFVNACALLFNKLEISELFFIPVFKDSWLHQDNTYPPVKKALKQIKAIVADKEYKEAIAVSGRDIADFILSVFWISRCNASMCEIYFSAPGSSIVFSVCKYGGRHLYFYDKKEMELFASVSQDSGFIEVDVCGDIFGGATIPGRQIVV